MLSLRNEWRDSADSVENLAALHALRLNPMKKPREKNSPGLLLFTRCALIGCGGAVSSARTNKST